MLKSDGNTVKMMVMELEKRDYDWGNITFLVLSPLIGLLGTGVYVYFNGIHWLEITLFFIFYFATGLSITAGYHRLFAHRSYDGHWFLKLFCLVFGAAALENTMLRWASDHRIHHKYVDTDRDPYNIKRGGWYAHIGWIFYKKAPDPEASNMSDFKDDPLVLWQSKYYVPIAILAGFALPAVIGLSVGRPIGCMLWAGFFRVVFVHHATFFINSWAHMFGRQPYSDEDTSRDSWWLALLTYGEGYHNFHHKFQADYRNGVRWYQWDPSKWLILAADKMGLAWKLNRTPPRTILNARLAMDLKRTRENIHFVAPAWWERVSHELELRKKRIELAHARFTEAKAAYMAQKSERYKRRVQIFEKRFKMKRARWEARLTDAILQARSFRATAFTSNR